MAKFVAPMIEFDMVDFRAQCAAMLGQRDEFAVMLEKNIHQLATMLDDPYMICSAIGGLGISAVFSVNGSAAYLTRLLGQYYQGTNSILSNTVNTGWNAGPDETNEDRRDANEAERNATFEKMKTAGLLALICERLHDNVAPTAEGKEIESFKRKLDKALSSARAKQLENEQNKRASMEDTIAAEAALMGIKVNIRKAG